jgi:hypothetical protein
LYRSALFSSVNPTARGSTPAVVKGFTEDDREVKHRSDFASMVSRRKVGMALDAHP